VHYALALAVAVMIIAAGTIFVWQTNRSLKRQFRQALREENAAGRLSSEIDPEKAEITGFDVKVPPAMMWRLELARVLVTLRGVLVPVLIAGSLFVAYILRHR
jgi:hypothetical protein